jgi:hypothetical protein
MPIRCSPALKVPVARIFREPGRPAYRERYAPKAILRLFRFAFALAKPVRVGPGGCLMVGSGTRNAIDIMERKNPRGKRAGFFHRHRLPSVGSIPPYSYSALVVVLACLAGACALRWGFGHFGATLYFATFYPAVAVAALWAGLPAAVAVISSSIMIVRPSCGA